MKENILRENDIRGRYPDEINEETVRIIGKAFAYYLNELNYHKCIVGHDNRLSSDSLNNSLIDSLLSSGIDVIDIGLVTTPILNYATFIKDIDYALMITASHNDKHDNGIKIFGKEHLHLRQEELQILYTYIKERKALEGYGTLTKDNINNLYANMLINKFGKINKKVVVDCGNGTASIIVKQVYSKIFNNVSYINSISDGNFPIHNPDPNVSTNLKWLQDEVKLRNFDLGIAFDGDADRVGIVDNKGNIISTDYLIAIFCKEIINNNDNKNIVIDIKCSKAIEEEIIKQGGTPVIVKNGSAYIETYCHDLPSLLGGEYSGHIFFKDDYYGFDDGLYAGLRMSKLLMDRNTESSLLTKDMNKYYSTEEIRITVDDTKKEEIINKIKEYALTNNYKCNLIDGVRVEYEDGFSLIRKSNTGPTITMRFEASTKEKLEARQKEFTNKLNEIINKIINKI